MQQRPIELPSELAERRLIESKERDTAAVRVQREELYLAFEHGKKRRQSARLPRHRHDHGDPEVTKGTVSHADFSLDPPARPRRSDAEVKRFTFSLSFAG
jgi:hypothetical protein